MKWSDLDRWEKVGVVMVSQLALVFVLFILLVKTVDLITGPLYKAIDRGIDGWLKLAEKEDSDE